MDYRRAADYRTGRAGLSCRLRRVATNSPATRARRSTSPIYAKRSADCADLIAEEIAELKASRSFGTSRPETPWPAYIQSSARSNCAALRHELFQLVVRTVLIDEACAMQRVDPETGAIEANPQCPWRKPNAIPAEFLSRAK
jgi:hypothetical protein